MPRLRAPLGCQLDNIFVERLWRNVKHDDLYLKGYANMAELTVGLAQYFAFYNAERPHQTLGYKRHAFQLISFFHFILYMPNMANDEWLCKAIFLAFTCVIFVKGEQTTSAKFKVSQLQGHVQHL